MAEIVAHAKSLCFAYGDRTVLKNIDFTVEAGDFVGVIGSNGTGKSTLMKLMLGILAPTSGETELLGEPAAKLRGRERVGYVAQNATAFNGAFPASVEEIVRAGLFPKIGVLRPFPKRLGAQVDEALERVGMIEYKKRLVGRLSGGQQQRVMLARMLVSRPELVFLDEPTVGVDTTSVASILELIVEMNQHGMTVIMTSHDIPSLLGRVSHVLLLDEDGRGRLHERGEIDKDVLLGRCAHC